MKHPSEDSIGWALAHAARLHRFHLNEKLSDIGLVAGQEQVLQVLDCNGTLTLGNLATILRVRAPTASKAVTRLTALGLVERSPDPGDGRLVRVRLTKKGRAAAARVEALWDEVESDTLAEFDVDEREQLRKLLLRAGSSLARTLGGDERVFDAPLDALDDHRAHPQGSDRTRPLSFLEAAE
jgi:DNA-binding MarR family transcriptional regulator